MDIQKPIAKALLKHEFYLAHGNAIDKSMFDEDLHKYIDAVLQMHKEYATDLELPLVYQFIKLNMVNTKPQLERLDLLFKQLDDAGNPDINIIGGLLANLTKLSVCRQLVQEGVCIIDGTVVDDTRLKDLCTTFLSSTSGKSKLEEVDIDWDTLKTYTTDDALPMAIGKLQAKIGGIMRGNLVIGFGRPEVGKSSFWAYQNVHWMRLGYKVAYFGNEESAAKIARNHVRACSHKSDDDLHVMSSVPEWDAIKDNFKLFRDEGIGVTDIEDYVTLNKPDVVIVDIADKVNIKGVFASDHLKLKEIYRKLRAIAIANDCVVVALSQASAAAAGKPSLGLDMLDGSRTGKAGEADVIIGVGMLNNSDLSDDGRRCISVSKNKNNGWHGSLWVMLIPSKCQWVD